MIVVHPYDLSTRMLSEIYKGIEGVTLFDSWKQRKEILKAIAAAPKDEPILLLGHGCPSGLLDLRHGIVIVELYLHFSLDMDRSPGFGSMTYDLTGC